MKVSYITPDITPLGWRARRWVRRRLAEQDHLGAQLAELTRIRDLAAAAREVVAAGWVKDAWYVGQDARRVDLAQARRMGQFPVERACLVGAILHAGGGGLERRHPARAAHVRPDLAHRPPRRGRAGALVPGAADPRPAPA